MKWGLLLVDLVIWYFTLYYLLFVIKNAVDLRVASLILLVLGGLGFYFCPWFRETVAWKKMIKA